MVDNKVLSVKFYLRDVANSMKKIKRKRVYCRIGYDRKTAEIALDLWYKPSDWDKKKELPRNDESVVEQLHHLRSKIFKVRSELVDEKKRITAQRIKMVIVGKEFSTRFLKKVTLIDALAEYERYSAKNIQIENSTKKSIQVKINRWREFISSKQKGELLLHELDKGFLFDMDNYFVNSKSKQYKKPLTRNYINHLHKFFRTFLNWCVLKNYLKENPYKYYKLKKDDSKSTIKYLTEDEIMKMKIHNLHGNERLNRVKDMFLFCCFTGLRYGDVTSLYLKEISQTEEGYAITLEKQKKTGRRVYIPLLEPAKEIFFKYKDSEEAKITGKLFPYVTNQKANVYLKEIGTLCNIAKPLNFHMSRHTCGTYLISNGMSLDKVADILGHTDTKTTRIYAKLTGKSLEDSMKSINEKLVKQMKDFGQT